MCKIKDIATIKYELKLERNMKIRFFDKINDKRLSTLSNNSLRELTEKYFCRISCEFGHSNKM